jgi:hypothetical protein
MTIKTGTRSVIFHLMETSQETRTSLPSAMDEHLDDGR